MSDQDRFNAALTDLKSEILMLIGDLFFRLRLRQIADGYYQWAAEVKQSH